MEQDKLVDLEKVKEAVSFYDLALHLGEKSVSTNYNSVMMCCSINPQHKDDTPSFVYNVESKRWRCFGCKESGDVFDYVTRKLQLNTFKEALNYLLGFTKINPEFVDRATQQATEYRDFNKIFKKQEDKRPEFNFFTEGDVDSMVQMRGEFYADKGFSKETLDFFEVGFSPQEKRVILPIRDLDGKLVGATGRTIHLDYKDQQIPKWKHYKNSQISRSFYNIHNAIKYAKKKDGSIILVEGPNDVMALHQAGYGNVVACMSNSIGNAQKTVLLKTFMSVYLFLDADAGGDVGRSSIYKQIQGYFDIYDVRGPEGKDPGDMTAGEITKAINDARKV